MGSTIAAPVFAAPWFAAPLWATKAANGELTQTPLLSGDVIYRASTPDTVSLLIQQFSPLPQALWTHVGIVLQSNNTLGQSVWHVLHALPEVGVSLDPLASFSDPSQARALAVLRPQSPSLAKQLVHTAMPHLGKPFDNAMRLSDTQTLYCTQLLALAWPRHGAVLSRIRVPMYSEPIIHPDGLWLDMLNSGDFKLLGTTMNGSTHV